VLSNAVIIGSMKRDNAKPTKEATPFDRFKELARKLASVPKKEVDAKEAAYQRRRALKKRRSA